jgi:hypothetical protein
MNSDFTTVGYEWEPQALVSVAKDDLPEGVMLRVPFASGKGWQVTLEKWTQSSGKPSDCVYNLEVQIGVAVSNTPGKFNTKDLTEYCRNFNTEFWSNVIRDQEVVINDVSFPVLAFIQDGEEFTIKRPLVELYNDCLLEEKYDDTSSGGYYKILGMVGTPQITFGMSLSRVMKLFAHMKFLYNKCDDCLDQADLDVLYSTFILPNELVELDSHTLDEDKIADEDQYFNLLSLMLISNVILVGLYRYFYASGTKGDASYPKAYFPLKPRTNILLMINDLLDDSTRGVYYEWIETAYSKILVGDDKFITKTKRAFASIINQDSALDGYVIESSQTQLQVPKLGIYSISDENLVDIEANSTIRRVKAGSFYGRAFPSIIYKDNSIQFESEREVNAMTFIGEWAPDGNTVAFEIRKPSMLYDLYSTEKMPTSNVSSVQLCSFMEKIVDGVLSASIEPIESQLANAQALLE